LKAYCKKELLFFVGENMPKTLATYQSLDNWDKCQIFIKKIFKENLVDKADKEFGFRKCLQFKEK